MPSRRKPTSTRQKKAEQQLKRAIKRGDVPPPEVKKQTSKRTDANAVRKLQSAFVKTSPGFLEETKALASSLPLLRPIPNEKAVFQGGEGGLAVLTCPKRPKWRYDQSKLEVERNEEGLFKKWLSQTDEAIEQWKVQALPQGSTMPRSTTYFERNLEVWRQLWRVTEISQIMLVLLDSRCPLLHFPPSLSAYLADRKIILVLTKVDISGHARVQAWIKYLHEHYPNSRVVQVESYVEKEGAADQGRKLYEPHIPDPFRETLVNAIREVHAEMLEPPDRVKQDPTRLEKWVPSVKKEVDWEAVLRAKGDRVGLSVGGAAVPRPKSPEDGQEENDDEQRREHSYLTIGLIGQPNVGKSSLLNALFGACRVRSSRTPGKTKHFQTLYWTADVRLVDCPGLVMPSFVPMETQVLSGVLPISRVSAIPACIYHASEFLPLERIYNLSHPSTKYQPKEDKRTWREGMKLENSTNTQTVPKICATDILTAYADKKGWVTAKAGRPDVNRAGNAILRALAEGRVAWAFWPPGTPLEQITSAGSEGNGIWIPLSNDVDRDDHDVDSESGEEERHVAFDTDVEEIEASGDDDEGDVVVDYPVIPVRNVQSSMLLSSWLGQKAGEEPQNLEIGSIHTSPRQSLSSPADPPRAYPLLTTPHDAVLSELHGTVLKSDDTPSPAKEILPDTESTPPLDQPSSRATSSNVLTDPFDGSVLGILLPQGQGFDSQNTSQVNLANNPECGPTGMNANPVGSDAVWSQLSRVLDIQSEISKMHLDMETIGLNKIGTASGDWKGKRPRWKGHRKATEDVGSSPYLELEDPSVPGMNWQRQRAASTVSTISTSGEPEGDEPGVNVHDDEEEKSRLRGEEFAKLSSQFEGRKVAIHDIMSKLDDLSQTLSEFHALPVPNIEFPSSRNNSSGITSPGTRTDAELLGQRSTRNSLSPNSPTRKVDATLASATTPLQRAKSETAANATTSSTVMKRKNVPTLLVNSLDLGKM